MMIKLYSYQGIVVVIYYILGDSTMTVNLLRRDGCCIVGFVNL